MYKRQLMRLLKEDKLGARSIDTIKPSDAKEWALRMKEKGFSYNTINNHKRSLKASFYIAIQDDCVRTVSYTHLDVYKRQVTSSTSIIFSSVS